MSLSSQLAIYKALNRYFGIVIGAVQPGEASLALRVRLSVLLCAYGQIRHT